MVHSLYLLWLHLLLLLSQPLPVFAHAPLAAAGAARVFVFKTSRAIFVHALNQNSRIGTPSVAQWASSCCPQCCHTHSAMRPPAGGPHVSSSLCAPCGQGELATWRRDATAAVAHFTGLARFLVKVNSHTHTHMYTLAPTHMSFGIGLLWAL